MTGPVTTAAVLAGLAAGAAGAAAGLVVPAAVARLPRPRDLAAGVLGPDYPALARRAHLRPTAVAVGAVAGVVLGVGLGADPVLPAAVWLAAAALPLAYVDLREHRLPDAVLGPAAAVLGVLLLVAATVADTPRPLLRALLGALATGGFLLAAVLARPDGLGLGDVKLSLLTGAVLGWQSWAAVLLGLLAGLALGAGAAVILVAARRADRSTAIALGPALLAGALLVVALHGP